eukprot:TRINITY_DN2555_c0_g1_i1.p1 TRINITY_DN2555_c0_g1~~TRINITY_DN2555_c0_g1_i1.p1  ORF type:complete len:114 (+),score=26.05 TRINITY_DN2555_c0_g1_i1:231-572(+)
MSVYGSLDATDLGETSDMATIRSDLVLLQDQAGNSSNCTGNSSADLTNPEIVRVRTEANERTTKTQLMIQSNERTVKAMMQTSERTVKYGMQPGSGKAKAGEGSTEGVQMLQR